MAKKRKKTKRTKGTKKTDQPAESPDLRFQDSLPLKLFRAYKIGIAGVGAVGRQVVHMLGTMGHNKLYCADPDVIELKNVGCQGWCKSDIGLPKTQVVSREVHVQHGSKVTGARCIFQAPSLGLIEECDIIFCCVDTMRHRDLIWKAVKERGNPKGLFLDSRLSPRVIRILSVDLGRITDRNYYDETFYLDADAEEGSCTDRMTFYGATVGAGLLVSQMANWLRNMMMRNDILLNSLSMDMYDLKQQKLKGRENE